MELLPSSSIVLRKFSGLQRYVDGGMRYLKCIKHGGLLLIMGDSPQDVIAAASLELIKVVGILKVGARESAERMLRRESQHLAAVLVVRHVEPALEKGHGPPPNLVLREAGIIVVLVVTWRTSRPPPLDDVLRPGRRRSGLRNVLLVLDGGDGGLAVEADEDEVDPETDCEQGEDDAVRARFRHDGDLEESDFA